MLFEPKTLPLSDGRTLVLRPAETSDAADMIEFLRTMSDETPFVVRTSDEIRYTNEDEARFLEHCRSASNELMIAAEVDGKLAGNCSVSSCGQARRKQHRCAFAIGLKKAYWHLGIGTALMETALPLAQQMGFEQIELEVIDGNERAMRLYERFGFQATGREPRALKYDDGSYADAILMSKFF